LPECHFKVAELKMRLVPGAVSRRVGWEVASGGRGWRVCVCVCVCVCVGTASGGGLCLLGGASVADLRRFLQMGSRKVPRSEDAGQWRRTSSGGSGVSVSVRLSGDEVAALVTFTSSEVLRQSPVHPQSSSKNTSRG